MDRDDVALDAAAALGVVDAQRQRVARRVTFDPALLNAAWAIAWSVGFGAAYLAYGAGRVVSRTSAAAAVLAGVPANFLVLSLAGGGGFALLAAWTAGRRRR